jgi:predicted carbohydrate-binding protein with CBM5 and CBM33 domain
MKFRRLTAPGAPRPLKLALLTIAATVAAFTTVLLGGGSAAAHGAPMNPGSRTFLCYEDGLSSTGQIIPKNAACAAAAAQSGTTPFYNWFSVLRSDGAGRTSGFIPDGSLCSGGNATFSGFDLARDDWPVTHLTSGATYAMRYNAWAAHPGTFYQYVTKAGYNPTKPLAWSDLESTPFATADHPPETGPVGTLDGHYDWTTQLPSGKTGPAVIYTVWARSDSTETFYSCSDVVFDGGNGEVTGVNGGTTGGTSSGTSAGTSSGTSAGTSGGSTPPPGTACTATFKTTNTWSGGYQAEVTVANSGTAPLLGWMVMWSEPAGNTIASLWNGTLSSMDGRQMAENADWNGPLAVGGSTTFGYVANGTAPPASLAMACQPG